ncbi:twin-arginine translocase TatA/TatE family subunit [Rhodothermus marinus]|jgi:sec-independent protein translocase protein TatA|uniref:Sec-independent protein translocase protein TatA n=1 Tax=Rhodothermus marinus (strain ATCC 43812 / DSM 4252 / R-10) TaxID=518766 RepID=D0MFC1_RHOM4|nr:twin-arginine translocase TatA/TatE family subunit [Rhodothermus marinus]ACY49377.1 twin-arginine translocation protein, TatA/E family subunit [Rhodothermus marinus DSM 4252]BBM70827.1 hypothetical protein RmaAA213_26730 [Rhodothermus marinus]BBM73810.1 hypothetical protein RmaAA338_26750 [Rhodothermus marinus]
MFGNIGAPELLLIFLVVLLVFGAKRIPEIARGLGRGIREFKEATREISREISVDVDETPQIRAPQQGTPTARTTATPTQQPAAGSSQPSEPTQS